MRLMVTLRSQLTTLLLYKLAVQSHFLASLVPRPLVGEPAWQLTRVQTVNGYDVKKITAALVQTMNIG